MSVILGFQHLLLLVNSLSISPSSILNPWSFISSSFLFAKNNILSSKYPKSPVLKLLFSYFGSNFWAFNSSFLKYPIETLSPTISISPTFSLSLSNKFIIVFFFTYPTGKLFEYLSIISEVIYIKVVATVASVGP